MTECTEHLRKNKAYDFNQHRFDLLLKTIEKGFILSIRKFQRGHKVTNVRYYEEKMKRLKRRAYLERSHVKSRGGGSNGVTKRVPKVGCSRKKLIPQKDFVTNGKKRSRTIPYRNMKMLRPLIVPIPSSVLCTRPSTLIKVPLKTWLSLLTAGKLR